MDTSRKVWIGLGLGTGYYMLDAIFDFLVRKDLSLSASIYANIPSGELVERFLVLFLLGILVYYYFKIRESKETLIHIPEDGPYDVPEPAGFLNSFAIVEMIAAQMKTTMNTVLGFLNLVKDNTVSGHTREVFTEYVYTSSSSLLQLFNNLVDLYHLHNGKTTKTLSTLNINQVLIDLRKKYEAELQHKTTSKVELHLHLPDDHKALEINTDKNKLITILESLLQNAIGFSDIGTINFGYTVVQNNEIQFFFHDKGVGISLEQLETAFKDYINKPNGMDISYDLAVLRMEVARRLSVLLGARIWSRSKLGSGSSFYLSLPLEKQVRNVKKEILTDEFLPDWKSKKILIAEDIDSNYMLLENILSATRAEITRAKNGSEAVHIHENNSRKFDAVLMDIIMPEMDGFEAAEHIRKVNKHIPIIGQTAYCLDLEKENGKLKHFNDFLTKPIWKHELLRTLGKYI